MGNLRAVLKTAELLGLTRDWGRPACRKQHVLAPACGCRFPPRCRRHQARGEPPLCPGHLPPASASHSASTFPIHPAPPPLPPHFCPTLLSPFATFSVPHILFSFTSLSVPTPAAHSCFCPTLLYRNLCHPFLPNSNFLFPTPFLHAPLYPVPFAGPLCQAAPSTTPAYPVAPSL